MVASPSLPPSEAMYFIPGTPLMALSKGMMTDLIINSPLAPGYSAETFTLRGDMEGNCVTVNGVMARIPRKTIIRDITMDSTGLCINLLNIDVGLIELFGFYPQLGTKFYTFLTYI